MFQLATILTTRSSQISAFASRAEKRTEKFPLSPSSFPPVPVHADSIQFNSLSSCGIALHTYHLLTACGIAFETTLVTTSAHCKQVRMFGKNDDGKTLPIYTAVLFDAEQVSSSEAMRCQKEPLLSEADGDSVQRRRRSSTTSKTSYATMKALCFVIGSLLGIVFSMTGFYIQEQYQFQHILYYSLSWSCFTSAFAYIAFFFWMYDENDEKKLEVTEFYFALGVFLGFCGACTTTDIVLGMPWQSIVVTVLVALCWAMLMAYCANTDRHDGLDEDSTSFFGVLGKKWLVLYKNKNAPQEEGKAFLRQRKGTVLPTVYIG